MQIAQFVWGASYAAAHLFIKYDVPVSTPYQVVSVVKAAVSSVSSAASAASSTASKVIESPAASGTLLALAKKMLLRAIGEEGIAEHVTNKHGEPLNEVIQEQIQAFNERTEPTYETKWRTELTKVNCIDTSGEAFAIYLNLFYLAPLTFLFARFFVRAYTNFGKPRNAKEAARQTRDSGKEAKIKTEEKIEETGRKAENKISKIEDEMLRKDMKALKDGTLNKAKSASQKASKKANELSGKASQKASEASEKASHKASEVSEKASQKADEVSEKASQKANEVSEKTQEQAKDISQKAQSKSQELSDKAKKASNDNNVGSGSLKKKSQQQSQATAIKSETDDSSESAQTQDKILAASQDARPGVKAEDESSVNALPSDSIIADEDTDAMVSDA